MILLIYVHCVWLVTMKHSRVYGNEYELGFGWIKMNSSFPVADLENLVKKSVSNHVALRMIFLSNILLTVCCSESMLKQYELVTNLRDAHMTRCDLSL